MATFKPNRGYEKKEKAYIKAGDKSYIKHEEAEVKAAKKNVKKDKKVK
jgi:hypothetical protein